MTYILDSGSEGLESEGFDSETGEAVEAFEGDGPVVIDIQQQDNEGQRGSRRLMGSRPTASGSQPQTHFSVSLQDIKKS